MKQRKAYYSILGDSISTLRGCVPNGFSVYYTDVICSRSGVKTAADTWWGKLIAARGGRLLVNNAWSGSRVTAMPQRNGLFPSGCSDERTSQLHNGNISPDVIIVLLGFNDWSNGVEIRTEGTRLLTPIHYDSFEEAYEAMVSKLRTNYPGSELWCCTLPQTYVAGRPQFTFPESFAGIPIENYNDVIRGLAQRYPIRVIDLYRAGCRFDTMDGLHPTELGMRQIAESILELTAESDPRFPAKTEELSEPETDTLLPPTELLSEPETGTLLPPTELLSEPETGTLLPPTERLPESETGTLLWNADAEQVQETTLLPGSVEANIAVLEDTLRIFHSGAYQRDGRIVKCASLKQLSQARVFLPEEIASLEKTDRRQMPAASNCRIFCENMDSFSAAVKLSPYLGRYYSGRRDPAEVLVLNFANPFTPGGGVRRGARAQEEDLCRNSSLLISLESNSAKGYYSRHRELLSPYSSDAMILSPSVQIIKDANHAYLPSPVSVAVLTCAAPMLQNGTKSLTQAQYQNLLSRRIDRILCVAAHLGYRILVLGAFGCGAFGNDPELVAGIFHSCLKRYCQPPFGLSRDFHLVDFAVLDRSEQQRNFKAFQAAFGQL